MENELYDSPVEISQADFVEKNASGFMQAEKLVEAYRKLLCEELREALRKNCAYECHHFN